jgi:hypothetical protein
MPLSSADYDALDATSRLVLLGAAVNDGIFGGDADPDAVWPRHGVQALEDGGWLTTTEAKRPAGFVHATLTEPGKATALAVFPTTSRKRMDLTDRLLQEARLSQENL